MHRPSASPSFVFTFALAVMGASACVTAPKPGDDPAHERVPDENVSELDHVGSALTSACRLETVGLPCDPDGAGEATECEGVCWVNTAAEVSCVPVFDIGLQVTDLNGRICGDAQGGDCSRSCENGLCVDKNARLGTACRPSANATTCDGVCTLLGGEAVCDAVDVCDGVELSADGCRLTACNFDTFERGCATYELRNRVCQASQPDVDGDASGEDASVVDASPVDASVRDASGADDAGGSSDASATSGQPNQRDGGASSSGVTWTSTTHVADSGVDAGVDAGSRPRPRPITKTRLPARVVGGACSFSPSTSSGVASLFGLLCTALLLRRRSTRDDVAKRADELLHL